MKRYFLCAIFFSTLSAFAQQQPGEVIWGYSGVNGPNNWGNLSIPFELCVNGKSQSPIDISNATSSHRSNLQISYQPAPLTIMNEGFTTLTMDQQTLEVNDGKSIQVNFSKDVPEMMKFGNIQYQLLQFHFHTPAEHQLNGKNFPAEIHFVNQGPTNIAVIGVFVKAGRENAEIQKILNNIPKEHDAPKTINNIVINPMQLLPTNRSYFTYAGSLTTPPCLENVQWIVMEQPIEASTNQIQKLRAAIGEDNVRPIQPLNGRRIVHVVSL